MLVCVCVCMREMREMHMGVERREGGGGRGIARDREIGFVSLFVIIIILL